MTTPGRSPTPRGRLAVAGGLAAGGGIVVGQALTNALHARATPIQSFAEVVIAKTPGSLADALIHLVGRNDKPILVDGTIVVTVLLGVLAGVLSARRLWPGMLLFAVMGAIAFAATVGHGVGGGSGGGLVDVLPVAGGVVTWFVVLSLLVEAARPPTVARADAALSRRAFVLKAGGVALGALVVGVGGQFLGRSRRTVEAARARLRLPITQQSPPAGAQGGLSGLTSWQVPNASFYRIDTALVLPAVDPDQWQLRIHGMVDHEMRLSFADLIGRRITQAWVTICCVSNPVGGPLIGNAWWSGVRIADLLHEAGVHPAATAVKQTSADGWTCGTPIQALTDGRNAMLAVGMNGKPLPIEHGFPVRMIVPGLYGYVSACKWLVDLEVTTFRAFSAYWTQRGWSPRGPVKTESRIEVPGGFTTVPAGTVRVGGHAWAQHTGIAKVEYRLDGAPWRDAELGRVPSVDTWVQWVGTVQVPKGRHTLAVRATDKSGYTQTAVRHGVIPNGATGWHTVQFTAS